MAASRGDDIWSDPDVRGFLDEVVGAIKRVSAGSSDTTTLMEAVIASRSHQGVNHCEAWGSIVSNPKQIIEGEYLLLRQGLGREGRNRLDVSVADGEWVLSGDRIADALGLAVGTPDDSGVMKWRTIPLSHISDRVWPLDRSIFEGELVTFATFNESQITSAWQGSLAPPEYEGASAS